MLCFSVFVFSVCFVWAGSPAWRVCPRHWLSWASRCRWFATSEGALATPTMTAAPPTRRPPVRTLGSLGTRPHSRRSSAGGFLWLIVSDNINAICIDAELLLYTNNNIWFNIQREKWIVLVYWILSVLFALHQCCSRVTMPRVRVQARVSSVRVRVKSKSLKKNPSRVRVESTTHTSQVRVESLLIHIESESSPSPSRVRVSTKA